MKVPIEERILDIEMKGEDSGRRRDARCGNEN